MRKKLLSFVITVMIAFVAVAQENGLNPIYQIQVDELQYQVPKKKKTATAVLGVIAEVAAGRVSESNYEVYAPSVNAQVKSALTKVRRMLLVESPDAACDVRFSGTINHMTTTTETNVREYKDSKGKVIKENHLTYYATVGITLQMTWADGVVQSHNFATTAYDAIGMISAEKALQSAIQVLHNKIVKFFNKEYALAANIVERGADKKDKQKEVYLDLGALNGVKEDMHFLVYEVGQVAGRETRKEVGKLRVEEVLGDDICLCKVQKGGKDIKAALDAGKRVMAFSID